jgi:hypothetical protein
MNKTAVLPVFMFSVDSFGIKTWQEVVVIYFKVLMENLSGGNEENIVQYSRALN